SWESQGGSSPEGSEIGGGWTGCRLGTIRRRLSLWLEFFTELNGFLGLCSPGTCRCPDALHRHTAIQGLYRDSHAAATHSCLQICAKQEAAPTRRANTHSGARATH
uniref:Uncharacterized protein n=1 Tax=Terrapene triunguis TaxID=2587831 RepID=A0A674KBY0_9SAUR